MSFGDFTQGLVVPALKVENTTVFITYASYLQRKIQQMILKKILMDYFIQCIQKIILDILLESTTKLSCRSFR